MSAPATFEIFQLELARLVDKFDRDYPQFVAANYNEATLRNEFLDPFFRALGWDVGNVNGLIHTEREVDIEVQASSFHLRNCSLKFMKSRIPVPTDKIFKLYALFGLLLFIFSPFRALAQTPSVNEPFTERTPAYFVSRYGSAKSSKTVSKYGFIHPARGNADVAGQFSVREFRSGELLMLTVFSLPSLKLASVTLQLPHAWTPEQIEAALAAYGPDWKQAPANSAFKCWVTPQGAKAVSWLNSLQLQSPDIVRGVEQSMRDWDAKGKAIPKF